MRDAKAPFGRYGGDSAGIPLGHRVPATALDPGFGLTLRKILG